MHAATQKRDYTFPVCRCGARITGLATAHCATCHHTFTTVSGFDKHRTGSHAHDTRHCLDPATMLIEKGDKAGEHFFTDAGRAYPCWMTNSEGTGFWGSDNESIR